MVTRRIKIWHFVLMYWGLLLVSNLSYIIEVCAVSFGIITMLISGNSLAFNLIDLSLVDIIASNSLFLLTPIVIVALRRRSNYRLSLLSGIGIILVSLFLYSPIIAPFNPEWHGSLRNNKLLPPFSSVSSVVFETPDLNRSNNELESYTGRITKLKRRESSRIIPYDSTNVKDDTLFVYDMGNVEAIEIDNSQITGDKQITVISQFHLLGTDELGRDLFSRIIYGTRISMTVGLGALLVSLIIGVIVGFLASADNSLISFSMSRIIEIFLSFPAIFLLIMIIAFFGNNLFSVIVILGFSGWMSLAKVVKGEIVDLKHKEYIITARRIGLKGGTLFLRELLPVIRIPIIVNMVFQFGNVILAEAALSYLGLGLGNNYPSWGAIIQSGQDCLRDAWWVFAAPALILTVTLLTANELGRSLSKREIY